MTGNLMDQWFGTRKWRVYTEADGPGAVPRFDPGPEETGFIPVHFSQGKFTIESPGAFMSPMGNAGRKGVVLQELGPDGKDLPGSLVAFGESVVAKAGEAVRV